MKRVISLLPSATEIIHALGAAESLVAVTHECDYPPQARSLPRVTTARIDLSMASDEIDRLVREQLDDTGSLYRLDLALVESLAPEIVLTQQLCTVCAVGYETVHAAMRSLASPPEVINLEPRTLAEVFDSFRIVARILEIPERGELLVKRLDEELRAIRAPERRPRVLLLEWLIPPFAAGHWMPELVEAAGGDAVLHFTGTHSRQIAWDDIDAADFDVLAISCCGFSVERALDDVAASDRLAALMEARPELRTVVLDGNHFFSRPGPRLVESARLLNAALRGVDPSDAGASVDDAYRVYSGESLRELLRSAPRHGS
jgi:iron complex transport system substrate-binding protein